MFKDLIRPAKVFGLHGLPMGVKILRQEANIQTFLARFGGRFASKEMILQRTHLWMPKNRDTPQARSPLREATAEKTGTHVNQDIEGPYPVCLSMTKDGKPYWYDNMKGEYWRCFSLEQSHHIKVPNLGHQAACMLGQYHETLSGFSAASLRECTADFVSTRESLDQLMRTVSLDPAGRSKDCGPEIQFAVDHTHYAPHVLSVHEKEVGRSEAPTSTHGINHLLPLESRADTCMADLKMAFPDHYPHRQLGDIRKTEFESLERDAQGDNQDSAIFTARLVEGFLGVIKGILLPDEFNHLTFSGKLLAYELGIRFLNDHLLGDIRFPTEYPGQNIHRARKQFRLAIRIDTHTDVLRIRERDLELR